MKEKLEVIKNDFIRLIKLSNNQDWISAEITIDFPPFINKGYPGSQIVKDSKGNNIRLIKYDEEFGNNMFDFIIQFNQDSKFNQIAFYTKKNDYENATIDVGFN